ncbi:hypothetical protein PCH_Pc12g01200 [Penicillium rubens Wisconsin 54-1255]|uniref:Uncharacterized protein n=1 Tax=Penicillium rubens (strain ATCC 28089 / DSM 1075 / NRRL 1951 / Wisconsin 54-1255) TaxID=500485 RepID=B6GYI2_PENRW|nr:hypothetical protein PCH_Pc12g01200 [Penicillium rubens Wisconsin 54-1255]
MAPAPKDASLAYMALLDILHVRLDVGRIRCLGLLEQGYVHGLSDFGLLATAASGNTVFDGRVNRRLLSVNLGQDALAERKLGTGSGRDGVDCIFTTLLVVQVFKVLGELKGLRWGEVKMTEGEDKWR